jgi:fluoride ion exporter CrcB/FEX
MMKGNICWYMYHNIRLCALNGSFGTCTTISDFVLSMVVLVHVSQYQTLCSHMVVLVHVPQYQTLCSHW